MLGALIEYVNTGTAYREELHNSDFIEILDKILAARPKKLPAARIR